MSSECRCPRCGTILATSGGRKGEIKAKARLFLTMQGEQTYICPKCGYETKSHTMLVK